MANFRSFWEMSYFVTHMRKWVWSLFEDSLVNTKRPEKWFRRGGRDINPPIGNIKTGFR